MFGPYWDSSGIHVRLTDDCGIPRAFTDVSNSDFRIPNGDDVIISIMLKQFIVARIHIHCCI